MTSDVRWGVLGCAEIAVRRLIPAMHAAQGNTVVAIGSRDLERAQATAHQLAIPHAYGSYAAVLEDPDVDAIYIPLPNSLHAEWTIRAAEAGKDVLVEKPMAPTVAECERMVAAAQAAGVRLMEAFMYRFHPQHALVRELIAAGAIGAVRMVRSAFCVRMQRPPTDIRFSPDLGGGSLLDVGVYAIDAVRWLLGADPTTVRGSLVLDAHGVDMSAAGILSFGDDVLATVTSSFVANGGGSYEVIGTDGTITVHQAFTHPPGRPPGVTWADQSREFPPDLDQYQLMLEAFAAAVQRNAPAPFAADAGVGNIRVIESLRMSPRP